MVNSKTIELLTYQDFMEEVKDSVKKSVGEEYSVNINHVIKNNSIELDGLVILKENERISPNIYLNSYYERYLEGEKLEDLVEDIVGIYMGTMDEGERETLCLRYEFDAMKSCIIYRLVNYEKNRKLLREVPHVCFLDLAVTFHCLVKNNKEGIGTIRITNEHMESWGTDIEELKEIARKNTPEIFPPVIKNMNEVILEIFEKDIKEMYPAVNEIKQENSQKDTEKSAEKMLDVMLEGVGGHNSADMYVLSNEKGINGASCMLYPGVIKEVAEQLGSDLYVLPSSIHEIILVKDNEHLNKKLLREMVFDVNRTQVPEEDILSNTVYYYSRTRDAISM